MATGLARQGKWAGPMIDLAAFNSLALILRDNPYPVYADLRERAPVFWAEMEQAWVLLRHKDVANGLTASCHRTLDLGQFVHDVSRSLGQEPIELLRLLQMVLFFRNPPSHGPLRSLVARLVAFRPKEQCAAVIEKISRRLVGPLARDGGMDLMSAYADPLPPLFMGWLFGFSNEDALWLSRTLAGVPVVLNRGCSMRDYHNANLHLIEANSFLRAEISRRRQNPADDGLSLLISRNAEADELIDDDRLAALASFVFMAGFETTSALIGSSLWLLLGHPQQSGRASHNPSFVPGAVNEALRLEPPIQQVRRQATADFAIADCRIAAGQQIILMIAAANRDPDSYADPHAYRPDRQGPTVLSFGAGLHHCLGGWIARLEAVTAMATILSGPKLRLASDRPVWRPYHNQRRLEALHVMVD